VSPSQRADLRGRGRRARTARAAGRLAVAALVVTVLVWLVIVPAGALAGSKVLYLGADGVPQALLVEGVPPAGTLPNLDPGRDDGPGLLLAKSSAGAAEADPTKYQMWVAAPSTLHIEGSIRLELWSAMKDFDASKQGTLIAHVFDCTPSGTDCDQITSGSITLDPWDDSGDWAARTIRMASTTHTVPAGRSLALKVVVGEESHDDMWLAYYTSSYRSKLLVPLGSAGTTTTSVAPASTTTTTTVPGSSSTSTTSTTSTTTTTTTSTPTTTVVETSSTTTVAPSETSTTTPGVVPDTGGVGGATTPPTSTAAPPVSPGGSVGGPDGSSEVDEEDRALLPLPGAGGSEAAERAGLSHALIEALELVIPPRVATAVVSPLLVLEALLRAFTDGGQVLAVPGILLLLGVGWMAHQSLLLSLLRRLRRRQHDEVTS
jgi:hypothetical protein